MHLKCFNSRRISDLDASDGAINEFSFFLLVVFIFFSPQGFKLLSKYKLSYEWRELIEGC